MQWLLEVMHLQKVTTYECNMNATSGVPFYQRLMQIFLPLTSSDELENNFVMSVCMLQNLNTLIVFNNE